jgi:hypothetical protein
MDASALVAAGSALDIEDAAGLSSALSACFPLDAAILDHCGRPAREVDAAAAP